MAKNVADEKHVVLDKWYYEEMVMLTARVEVLVGIISRDRYITTTDVLRILGTPEAHMTADKLEREQKGDNEE